MTDEVRGKIDSAMSMEAGDLVNNYRESLKFENNPLPEVYEAEILRRLWRLESLLNSINILA
jgi:hypothetical protein